jgi:hypothetical protein
MFEWFAGTIFRSAPGWIYSTSPPPALAMYKISGSFKNDTRNGKFINSVGNIGQSPGEYLTATDVCIDKKRREIVISGIEQISHYDFNGNYLYNQLVDGFNIGISEMENRK